MAHILASLILASFFLSVDFKYLPFSSAFLGASFFLISFFAKSGQKTPVYIFKFVVVGVFIISYAAIIDLLQGGAAVHDFRHVGNIAIVITSLFVGHAYYLLYPKNKCDDIAFIVMKTFVLIVTANSLAILIEVLQPEIRIAIEAILVETTRTDYLEGIRYRGFASAGGATLSIAMALSIAISVHMAKANLMSWYLTLTISLINLSALIFVGRTGLLLVAILMLVESIRALKSFYNVVKGSIFITMFVSYFYLVLTSGADGEYIDKQNYWHAFGIIENFGSQGVAGSIESEGTVPSLLGFYQLPESISALIFGIGNFTGGYFQNLPGDPGVMKLMTLVGLPGVIGIYTAIILTVYIAVKKTPVNKAFILLIAISLITLELKEPFLSKGASAKLLWVLLGIYLSSRMAENRNQSNSDFNTMRVA